RIYGVHPMHELLNVATVLPAFLLVALVLLPRTLTNRQAGWLRQGVTVLAGLQLALALTSGLGRLGGWLSTETFQLIGMGSGPFELSFYLDGVASLMLILVGLVGWVICRFSVRYLDGEADQGKYYRFTAFTLGSVSLMVVSGNLLLFVATWVMTSLGLHRLLLHYGDRPAAKQAAWMKFVISRIGDASLLVAVVLIYQQLKTLDFASWMEATASTGADSSIELQIASFLLVLGAITKSAQLPFHSWLPQTMETPTPVSALMHAGIVNAGGYLIIRASSIVSLSPTAMTVLAVIGGVTACFGAVVMTTQNSIKKSLAYSTVAQMGFMMLQCGLGAFSAAMLHILAHSLYKAHAFLTSGNVLNDRRATAVETPADYPVSWVSRLTVSVMVLAIGGLSFAAFDVNPLTKPGGVLLGGILCLALVSWVNQALATGESAVLYRSLVLSGVLMSIYLASFRFIDSVVAVSTPAGSAPAMLWLVTAVAASGFAALLAIHQMIPASRHPAWMRAAYVHATNGFYLDAIGRRIFAPLTST
ncbi:MAG: proton-conducting transporter membrane subunit, partial [Planctomycetota bacterium]